MAVDVQTRTPPPQVLRTTAAEVCGGDQVAFVSPDGVSSAGVAGEVTTLRRDAGGATVTLVVGGREHTVPVDHGVVVIRSPRSRSARVTAWRE